MNRLLVVALILTACSGDVAPPETQGARSASNREGGAWGEASAWAIAADPSLRIGQLDGATAYQFSRVSAATRQADGDIVVADAGSRDVRLFAVDGTYKATLGGAGDGPGQFQSPKQILLDASDSVFVWDEGAYRLTRFDSAGTIGAVQTIRRDGVARAIEPPLYPGAAVLSSPVALVVRLIGKELPSGNATFRGASGALRMALDLSRVDTLLLFEDVEQVVVDSPWGPLPLSPPLARTTSIATQPGGERVCIGDQAVPEVRCLDPGDPTTTARWDAAAVPVAENDPAVARWRDDTVVEWAEKVSADLARRVLEGAPVPTSYPYFRSLVVDREGRPWVERWPDSEGGAEWMVFDVTGTFLGSLAVPSVQVLEIGSDYILGVSEDDLGVQFVELWPILKPESGPATR